MATDPNILGRIDFGNEAGDDVEPEELLSYFVEQKAFTQFLDDKKHLLVATARKGVGKSALLKWTAHKVQQRDGDALVISVRGADLTRANFNLTTALNNPNEHMRDWMVRLCAIVNRNIASRINLALTDDRMSLIETAELDGYKSRNLAGALIDRMQKMLEKIAGTAKLPIKNEVELLKRLKVKNVWIIIDDLDATFQNTDNESLSLATFFSACRYLVKDVKGLYIRASIRTDVWAILRRYDEALDKMSQYVSEILWKQHDFLGLLSLRIRASVKHLSSDASVEPKETSDAEKERLLEMVFVPQMPWGDSRRKVSEMQPTLLPPRMVDTYKVVYTLSYERPRWAIQLCKLAQEAALKIKSGVITKQSIDDVWGEYGAKRIADLVAEHKHQCPQVNELINSFRGAERLMTRAALLAWIKNHVSEHLETRSRVRSLVHRLRSPDFFTGLGLLLPGARTSTGSTNIIASIRCQISCNLAPMRTST